MADLLFDYIYGLGERSGFQNEQQKAAFDDRMFGVMDWLGPSSFAHLDTSRSMVQYGKKTVAPKITGSNEQSEALRRLQHRFQYDFGGLGLILPSLRVYHGDHGEDGPPRDIFTKELMRFFTVRSKPTKRRPYIQMWLLWATAVFLDINATMMADTAFGFQDLQPIAAEVRSTYE